METLCPSSATNSLPRLRRVFGSEVEPQRAIFSDVTPSAARHPATIPGGTDATSLGNSGVLDTIDGEHFLVLSAVAPTRPLQVVDNWLELLKN